MDIVVNRITHLMESSSNALSKSSLSSFLAFDLPLDFLDD